MTKRNTYYLNKREGKIFGVCAGFADYLGVDSLWVRVAVVLLTLLVSFITIPLYIAIAVLASRRPDELYDYRYVDEDHFREPSRRRARARSELGEMDRRLSDIETHYGQNSRLAADIERLR